MTIWRFPDSFYASITYADLSRFLGMTVIAATTALSMASFPQPSAPEEAGGNRP